MTEAEWREGFDHELDFWRAALAGQGEYLSWRLDQMLSPQGRLAKFPVRLLPFMHDVLERTGCAPSVLDIGSGPLSTLAWAAERGLANVVAIDPLAEQYREMMTELGIHYPVIPETGVGEQLTDQFPRATFDIVYSRNALDHCESPRRVVAAAVDLLREGGTFFVEGAVAEGTQQAWQGLHQHDILPTEVDLCHRSRDGVVSSLTRGLPVQRVFAGRGQGAAEPADAWEQNDWYVLVYRKLAAPR